MSKYIPAKKAECTVSLFATLDDSSVVNVFNFLLARIGDYPEISVEAATAVRQAAEPIFFPENGIDSHEPRGFVEMLERLMTATPDPRPSA